MASARQHGFLSSENWDISKAKSDEHALALSPENLVEVALEHRAPHALHL